MPVPHARRRRGGAILKTVGAVALLGLVLLGYRAYGFYQEKVAPVVEGVSQVAALAANAVESLEALRPFTLSQDSTEVAEVLRSTFDVAPPPGYVGSLVMQLSVLGTARLRMVAVLPRGVEAASVFSPEGNSIRFNAGPSTMFLATAFSGADPDEIHGEIAELVAGDGTTPALQPVFAEVGGRRVALLRGAVPGREGARDLAFAFLDGGRMLFANGPQGKMDEGALTALLTELVARHPDDTLLYTHPTAPPVTPPSQDACGIPGLGNDFDVVMVSVSRGSTPLDIALDRSGDDVTEERVVVGVTPKPVVLVLAGEDPIVWNVGRTDGARIAGVLAQGNGRQAVIGLPPETRLTQYSTEDGPNACRAFHAEETGPDSEVKQRVRELFGRRIGTFLHQKAGESFTVGEVSGTVWRDERLTIRDVALPDHVLPGGKRGLQRLKQEGKIREATAAEVDRWVAGAARMNGRTPEAQRKAVGSWAFADHTYIVLAATELPPNLYGGNSRQFLVPTGVPVPSGDPGHSTILLMDGFACRGSGCR
jgi:hypothetical protein